MAERVATLEAENRRLRDLLGLGREDRAAAVGAWEPTLFPANRSAFASGVTRRSSSQQKVELFRALFRGRDDVYALRWESLRTGKSGWGPAIRGGWSNSRRPDRELLPLSAEVVADHLSGTISVGLYPLMDDDSCFLLVCDFDGQGGRLTLLPISTPASRRHSRCARAISLRRWRPCVGLLR